MLSNRASPQTGSESDQQATATDGRIKALRESDNRNTLDRVPLRLLKIVPLADI
jgi:hypothetical protein